MSILATVLSESETSLIQSRSAGQVAPVCLLGTMRLSKQSRGKKGRVAPMSDDEDTRSSAGDLNHSGGYQSSPESRGVSFSTSRGKIWLILVVNLAIVTGFIFMSSSRFPSLYGDGVVNDVLEQSPPHPGPVYKNADQSVALAAAHSETTEAPRAQETSRPGGYTKLTSTDHPEAPDEELDLVDPIEGETETDSFSDYNREPAETPGELTDDGDGEPEPTLSSMIQEPNSPVSDVEATAADGHSEPPSEAPNAGGARSSTELTDLTSRRKESEASSSAPLSFSPEEPIEEEPTPDAVTAQPESLETRPEAQPAAVESKDFLDNLSLWLTADSGVEVENLAACLSSSGGDLTSCGVNSWTNQITANSDPNAADTTAFRPASAEQRPVWVPIVPDTHNQLPAVYFSCPMVSDALRVHESMTLFFVLSPAQIETGDSYTGQKFFGNSPYGQFALHGGRPSFFASNGLVESAQRVPMGQFSLLAYRLHEGYVQIKANGGSWGGEFPVEGGVDDRRLRVTVNDVVTLGNSKSACDTNAFQGRVAEVLVYDAVLDDAKVESVEKYLHGKWWGAKSFPETAAPATTVLEDLVVPVDVAGGDATTAAPVDPAPEVTEVVSIDEPQTTEEVLEASRTETALDDDTNDVAQEETTRDDAAQETSATTAVATEEVDSTPAPKFDPRVNIFEWTPPSGADPARAQQWASTVKEKVDYIRNFQLGGDVLRALIREHRDDLVALREQLFG